MLTHPPDTGSSSDDADHVTAPMQAHDALPRLLR